MTVWLQQSCAAPTLAEMTVTDDDATKPDGSDRNPRRGRDAVEAALIELFPDVGVLRIDRDSTRRKGALQQHLQAATDGEAQILVGTQMLAKGHHFPNVTLVGVLDSDRGLYGTDFRSLEQMGQLIVPVSYTHLTLPTTPYV